MNLEQLKYLSVCELLRFTYCLTSRAYPGLHDRSAKHQIPEPSRKRSTKRLRQVNDLREAVRKANISYSSLEKALKKEMSKTR
jgi:hypothetical protein